MSGAEASPCRTGVDVAGGERAFGGQAAHPLGGLQANAPCEAPGAVPDQTLSSAFRQYSHQPQLHGTYSMPLPMPLPLPLPSQLYGSLPQETPGLQLASGALASAPSVIRTHSLDYTIEPESGRLVRFGPAVTHKLARAELPGIANLFSRVQPAAPPKPARGRRRARSQPQLAQEGGEAAPLPRSQPPTPRAAAVSKSPSPDSPATGSGSGSARRGSGSVQGFGSIVSGVLQAARGSSDSAEAARPAGVQVPAFSQLRGVRRQPWGVTWTAFLPAVGGQAERELGSFQDARSAARAHDLALLRLGAADPGALNWPAATYEGPELQELRGAPLPQFWAALARVGELAERRTSRYAGVFKAGKTSFEARLEVE